QIQLNAQIADLSTTLLPGHPRIKALRSQLGDLSVQIRSQARNVLDSLRNQAATERNREAELIADVNSLKAASSDANTNLVELRALERVAASQRGLLESYLIRFREARSRDETEYAPPNARVISTATVPTSPSFPKMGPILSATFVGALLLMILVTLLRELFSGRAIVPAKGQLQSPDHLVDTQRKAKANSAYETKPTASAPARPEPSSAASAILNAPKPTTVPSANDNFSVAALSRQLIDRGSKRAIVISPEGDIGSICTVGLVRAMADEGLRPVLVDLTGTAASSQHMVADYPLPGITDLLASQANYSDVIHADAASYAHVIPTGNADAEVAMRAADRLPIIIDALASAYDMVVVDCGATSAAGLKRLSTVDTEVIMAMVEPDSGQAIRAAEDLIVSGYTDVLIMTGDDMPSPISPKPDLRFA
ncbi:MAG: chain-length determining protein, partial [Pseudomonadota bacterium]